MIEEIKKPKVGAGVGVLILNKDKKILLGKRHDNLDKADSAFRISACWTMPGGKLEFGETFEECGKREVEEETGIKLNSIKVICTNNDMNECAHFITIGLISEEFEGEAKVIEPEEITEWGWFSLNNLPENLFFPSAHILENYKQNKFYIEKE